WERAATSTDARPGIGAVAAALQAHGVTLGAASLAYDVANLNDAYSEQALRGASVTPQQVYATGTGAHDVARQSFTVNHLAANYIEFRSGDLIGASAACVPATLHLAITLPSGGSAYFYTFGSAAPQLVPAVGASASLDVPWNTCAGVHGQLL